MRPVQWVKNVLIGIAPAAAGQLHNAGVLRHTGAAFVSFCALSSAIYILNDLRDIGQDRHECARDFYYGCKNAVQETLE